MIFIETLKIFVACDISLLAEKVFRSIKVVGYSLVAERQLTGALRLAIETLRQSVGPAERYRDLHLCTLLNTPNEIPKATALARLGYIGWES